ncbi:MAG: hypothetical protein NC253_10755 [Ruminococcus sp.]|nr:hypothetical protein [Ruminococcus sp.]MCM1380684.1 hypothetical protein [Muribaculaceae bacterium]MCM1479849.1 hypothetical protein [Muribaculaceae bacterium]
MIYRISRIFYLMAAFLITAAILPYNVNAAENAIEIDGLIYKFDEKSEYEISSSEPSNINSMLGKLSISGNISKSTVKDDISVFETTDGSILSFMYKYDDTLINAVGTDEHLTSDSKKVVDTIDLGEKIQNGTVIIQTSLDRNKWTTVYCQTNVFENVPAQTEAFYETNNIQLLNGCYYKIIVAYKTETEVETSKILWIDKKNYEYKKYAEVYEFYAMYADADNKVTEPVTYFNNDSILSNTKSKGYSGSKEIDIDNPHYGWELGSFFISGYTRDSNDNVFIKSVKNGGDKITLWFKLEQDIDKLNGDDTLSIAEDNGGYDKYFQTGRTDMGRGTLIIRHTDYRGIKSDSIIYENFLEALTSAGADTKIQLFEEGDYEVALDYKIKKDSVIDSYEDYRIFFTFKIRNGNCMVYTFDTEKPTEISGSPAISEKGFRIDLANSHYLTVNVKKETFNSNYQKISRGVFPAKDKQEFTEEGLYTITVTNPYIDSNDEQVVYVGTDEKIIASLKTTYSLAQILEMVEQGAEIQSDGTIIPPKPPETEPPVTETTITTETETTETSAETAIETETSVVTEVSVTEESEETEAIPVSAEATQNDGVSFGWVFIIIVILAAAAVGIITFIQKNSKTKE